MPYKPRFLAILLFLQFNVSCLCAQLSIIPEPLQYTSVPGSFMLDANTKVLYASAELKQSVNYFRYKLLEDFKLALPVGGLDTNPQGNTILLQMLPPVANANTDGYEIEMLENRITVKAQHANGMFYGMVSLLQMVEAAQKTDKGFQMSLWNIADQPKYKWRGFMLDVSRHFVSVHKVKAILDWMAYYKLNKFHWHLTDSQGWRLEIKEYPALANIGGLGNNEDPNAPAAYYTQEQIKEIVAYANERYISVIPEIDMPGHANAANRAYPEFNGGGSEKYPDFTFNPALDGTYGFLTNILKEVSVLFPSNLLHVGGDEVSFGSSNWIEDPKISGFMAQKKISTAKELELYFMERMADSIFKMNANLLAWDEMADSHLPTDKTILFWWRHNQLGQLEKLLDNGFKAVICPRIPFYFDFVQNQDHIAGRKWDGKFSTLQGLYEFRIEDLVKTENQKDQILGIQANLWTETVVSETRLDYLLFPRITGLAEAAWAAREGSWEEFQNRVKIHMKKYKKEGVYYYNIFDPKSTPEPIH